MMCCFGQRMAQSQDTTTHCEAKRPSRKCSQVGQVGQIASELQGLGSPQAAELYFLPSTFYTTSSNDQHKKDKRHGSNAHIQCLPLTCPWHRQARCWNSDDLRRESGGANVAQAFRSSAAGQVELILGATDPIKPTERKICESQTNHRVLAPHAGPARASAVHLELQARVQA